MRTREQAPLTPAAAPSDGRYLTAYEIAEELGQRIYIVRRALARVGEIPWQKGTRGTGPRIYHESALGAVAVEIGKLRPPVRGRYWQAILPELAVAGGGETQESAIHKALKTLISDYLSLEHDPSADPDRWQLFQQLVRRLPLTVSEPAGPPSPAVVLKPGTAPSFEEWLAQNAPQTNASLYNAWKNGAYNRLLGRSDCPYYKPAWLGAWKEGFRTMERFLKAGGVIACPSCMRPLPIGPPKGAESSIEEASGAHPRTGTTE